MLFGLLPNPPVISPGPNSGQSVVSSGSNSSSSSGSNSGLNGSNESNALNAASAQDVMRFNAEEAQKNRDWQEMMSNTSYQRAVADLKAAGINPLLAVQSLNGATTPGGSAASTSNQTFDNDNTVRSAWIRGLSQLISSVIRSAGQVATTMLNIKAR